MTVISFLVNPYNRLMIKLSFHAKIKWEGLNSEKEILFKEKEKSL